MKWENTVTYQIIFSGTSLLSIWRDQMHNSVVECTQCSYVLANHWESNTGFQTMFFSFVLGYYFFHSCFNYYFLQDPWWAVTCYTVACVVFCGGCSLCSLLCATCWLGVRQDLSSVCSGRQSAALEWQWMAAWQLLITTLENRSEAV